MKRNASALPFDLIAQVQLPTRLALMFAIGGISLSGCSPLSYLKETKAVDVTAAFQITERDTENISLETLLTTYAASISNAASNNYCAQFIPLSNEEQNKILSQSCETFGLGSGSNCSNEQKILSANYQKLALQAISQRLSVYEDSSAKVDQAYAYFACQTKGVSEDVRRAIRNSVQERMLAASQQRCNAFKGNLQRTFSRTNFNLGILTTISATAGALASAPVAASNWAGGAAVFSGARSEFNQDFMSNLAAHVIAEGIDKRRETIYAKIQDQGQNKSYDTYPIDAAVKDAIYYHGQCSVIAGFQEAGDAIKFANDPGLNQAITTVARLKATNKLLNDPNVTSAEEIMKQANSITNLSPSLVGSRLKASPFPLNYPTQYLLATNSIQTIYEKLNAAKIDIKKQLGADSEIKGDTPSATRVEGLFSDISLPDDWPAQKSACLNKVNTLATDESANITKAKLSTASVIEATKANDLANTYEKQGGMLADTFVLLAKNYEAQADNVIDNWKKITSGILSAEKTLRVDKLKKPEFDSAPKLDANLLSVATTLCK